MTLDFWSNFNKKMITEIEKKITQIANIDGRDAVNLSDHRCNLSIYLRYDFCPNRRFGSKNQYPERSEVR